MYHASRGSCYRTLPWRELNNRRPIGKSMRDETHSTPANAPSSAWQARLVNSISQLDAGAWVALLLIALGWFAFETLHTHWGPIDHGFRFYDMASILHRPARLFTGLEGERGIGAVLFTLMCCLALLAPLAVGISRHRLASLALAVPLALLLVTGALLYSRAYGDVFRDGLTDTVGHDVIHLANHILHKAGTSLRDKVSLGVGAYLALLGSAWLALRGARALFNPTVSSNRVSR